MSDKQYKDPEVCEACGAVGEIGYIIGEDDLVATVTISADNGQALRDQFQKYLDVANRVASEFTYETSDIEEDSTQMTAKLKFDVSAEKLIFELQSRSLNN